MVRILSVASLALAVVSAVSGHVIRRRHSSPKGWETSILEPYEVYHTRYLNFECYDKHNTTFFDKCCHPLLRGESLSVLYDRRCFSTAHDGDDCDDGNSSIRPTPTPYSHAVMSSSPEHNTPTSSPPESPAPTSSPPVHTASPSVQPKIAKPDSFVTSSTPETTYTSPSPSPTSSGNNGDGFIYGGVATFFYQKGNAGACGEVHSDSDLIVAIDQELYGDSGTISSLCGKQLEIVNLQNGKSVIAKSKDSCPSCRNKFSLDLSVGAFTQLAELSVGEFDIKWRFLS